MTVDCVVLGLSGDFVHFNGVYGKVEDQAPENMNNNGASSTAPPIVPARFERRLVWQR